ncbi:MAG: DUF2793 domain-containing protein [Sphingomonas sp.]|uniref:DUF2793 domain-containing protein n=1 Tax=Sphingomonas sp. TaxID=28214 RepID=UPI0025E1CB99|nr:DUF2793 domain-containing protein [Sphingomonas sp.]MBX3563122.1 DUF2793 domain-containing protein [Sphingomonas sp.]
MTDSLTPRLALPLLAAGQAQKEMSHNEALARIDMTLHGNIIAADAEIPPGAPEPGQCWILGSVPEADWAGHPHELAGWTGGGWRFVAPCEGMRLWLGINGGFALFSGGEWRLGDAYGRLIVAGEQVVGPRVAAITEPSGGATVDAEARATILAVLNAMREHGLVDAG